MNPDGCRIAVIGAGFSGVMTAIHLLWRCGPGERVYLVERVRAGRARPRLRHQPPAPPGQRPRGEHERVRGRAGPLPALARAASTRGAGRPASGPSPAPSSAARSTAPTSRTCCARPSPARTAATTCSSSPTRRSRCAAPAAASSWRRRAAAATRSTPRCWRWATCRPAGDPVPGFVANPWAEGALAGLRPGEPVVLLGTGLTMADVCWRWSTRASTARSTPSPAAASSPMAHAPGAGLGGTAAHRRRPALAADPLPRGPARGAARLGSARRLARGHRRRSARTCRRSGPS